MAEYVVDTHALYWYLMNDNRRMSRTAMQIMDDAKHKSDILVVPSIVMAELYFLNVKTKGLLSFRQTVQKMNSCAEYHFVSFTTDETFLFDSLAAISEMHDRIIAGVALARNIPVLTKDPSIINSGLVQTIW